MSLPENQLYSPYNSQGIVSAAKSLLGTKFRSPKAIGVSPAARGVANTVQSYASGPMSLATGTKTPLGITTTNYLGGTRFEAQHKGVDIANVIGTPIPSFTGGVVKQTFENSPGYGNSIVVMDDQGNLLRYSHLSQSYVKAGQKLSSGTILGTMGNTGSTYSLHGGSGSHLDLRMRDVYGRTSDPSRFIREFYKI